MAKSHTFRLLFLTTWFFVSMFAHAQTPKLSFEEFVIEDGLASVNCILRDREGFMWFGGTHGLYRYDGYKFKIFTSDDANLSTLSNNNVVSLYEDNQGFIWVGTMRGGINKYNPKTETFTNYKNTEHPIFNTNYITCITGDSDNTIWFGTFGDGLFSFNKKTNTYNKFFDSINSKKTISNNSVFSVVVTNTKVWITTNSGILDCYDKASEAFTYYRYNKINYQSTRTGQRLLLDSFNNLWIATEDNGLYKFEINSKSFEHYEKGDSRNAINSNEVTDIKEGNPGEIWMTTYGGLNLIDINTNKVSSYQNDIYDKYSITNNVSYCLFIDNDGTLWMGMGDGTVNKTIDSPFEIYQTSFSKDVSSLSFNVIGALYVSDNTLWIGTGGGGLDRFNLNTNTFYNYKNNPKDKTSLPSDIVMTVLEDKDNTIWTGNFKNSIIGYKSKGSDAFFEASFKSKTINNYNKLSVFDLVEDNNQRIWIATYNDGLYSYNKTTKELVHFNKTNSKNTLLTDKLLRLLVDKNNNLWIGTLDKGVQIYNLEREIFNSLSDLGSKDSINLNYPIKDLYEDNKGTIWIATEGNGIYYFDPKSKELNTITMDNGLPSNSVYGIIQDNENDYWFSTNKGIVGYTSKNKKIAVYNTNDGLPTNDFESGAIAKANDGKLFFGSKKGLIAFYPENLISTVSPINLMITNFRIFNDDVNVFEKIDNYQPLDSSIAYTKSLKLPYFLDNFGFEFAAPGYSAPHNIEYQYMLEGIDDRWLSTSSERHFANYSNIPHGDYIFKVKAFEENGPADNFVEKSIKIKITPVWWQTKLAYLIYFLTISSLIYYIYTSVQGRIRLKNELLIEKYKHDKDEELHQSKINFFTNISHELRTSLTLILSPLAEFSKVKAKNNRVNNLIMTMNRNGQRLLSLINQILDFRKMEYRVSKLQVQEIDIKSFFVELCIPFYQYADEKKIQFQLTVSNSCKKGWIDSNKLEIIVYNILSNAFKFTNTNIDINVDLDERDEKLIIKVKDNGKGIFKEDIDKIFENFYQAKSIENNNLDTTGSGIGLAIAKNLTDLHYGEISVKSQPSEFTVFKIIIPIAGKFYNDDEISNVLKDEIRIEDDTFRNLEKIEDSFEETSTKKLPIMLIVEDNFEIRNLIKNYFKTYYNVHDSSNGLDGFNNALEIIPDIIISDIMMPKMNGLELCKKLKTDERTSHIPIIMLTARVSHGFKIEGYEYGADDYITKPFDIELLNARVKNLVESRRILRETFRKEVLLKPKDIAINNVDEIFIEKIMSIVEEHMSDSKFSVAKLALEIGMSHSVLYRKIMALTGQNINEFLKSVKLARASQLIVESDYSINEISDMTGFSNPKYFSTCFKKKFGATPSRYKKQA
ncbi:two-component regulator propeller domain-containing protein [Aureibaculum sp. 2210JD6-5]|uniref:hybrid sensor histidine kinase/response regulator transcription factor n=1 Tax=Aureibaculum sp. 2210JD6-5 TaxID=3103957 RepID=UPI002AADAF89|nr:two-component regulator propeller domain-containing protein [Aureibaculum sp. 2210JD6-5]MDY7396072.1 two-component regulator propeller domain-containing protein [Aureibaculum sp. 2210JD6-5]